MTELLDIKSAGTKSVINQNLYHAYTEGHLLSHNPLDFVVALYEGAMDAGRSARLCLESGDIWGRTKAINKEVSILTELIVSLNQEKGGEIAVNLKKLYGYMQRRLLEAHAKKSADPIDEVGRLLGTMLDAWKQAAAKSRNGERADAVAASSAYGTRGDVNTEATAASYGSYWNEVPEVGSGTAFSF